MLHTLPYFKWSKKIEIKQRIKLAIPQNSNSKHQYLLWKVLTLHFLGQFWNPQMSTHHWNPWPSKGQCSYPYRPPAIIINPQSAPSWLWHTLSFYFGVLSNREGNLCGFTIRGLGWDHLTQIPYDLSKTWGMGEANDNFISASVNVPKKYVELLNKFLYRVAHDGRECLVIHDSSWWLILGNGSVQSL